MLKKKKTNYICYETTCTTRKIRQTDCTKRQKGRHLDDFHG